ncbi:hypothetical protein J122_2883 [Marinobacter excellens LAMA 842]|uniref:Uncharacterized protein n=1 Tax=Marinobacter excellens LAMA 842 TaxID=1306954 RepID=A0A137S6Z4_9GAMM|nr:hypothetical protein J122_2883 [Marinobacter excellens LAMA 842]
MFSNESRSHLNCSHYGQYFPLPASQLMSVCLEVFHGYYSHASARHSLPGFFFGIIAHTYKLIPQSETWST